MQEMMQRQLDDGVLVARHQFIMCMRPWLENLSFVKLRESDNCARLLKGLYYVTLRNGEQYPQVIESLWTTFAAKVRAAPPAAPSRAPHPLAARGRARVEGSASSVGARPAGLLGVSPSLPDNPPGVSDECEGGVGEIDLAQAPA